MKIQDKFKHAYTYLLYPESINATPLEVAFMEILDENDLGTGTYYSFADLSAIMGKQFVPVPYVKDGFLLAHLPLGLRENASGDNDHKELAKELKKLLKQDMRQGLKKSDDIDYTVLDVDAYGFFDAVEVLDIPKSVTVEEPIA